MKALNILFSLMIPTATFAGTVGGGGGSGVAVYKNAQIEEVIALDLYRAYENPDFALSKEIVEIAGSKNNEDVDTVADKIVRDVFGKLAQITPSLLAKIAAAETKIGNFKDSQEPLETILDYGQIHLRAPNHQVIQVLRRYNHIVEKDAPRWKKVNAVNRAAFRLHEIIHAISDHSNTVNTQKLVAVLLSEKLSSLSPEDFQNQVAAATGFKYQALSVNDLEMRYGGRLTDQQKYLTAKQIGADVQGLAIGLALDTISNSISGDEIPARAVNANENCGYINKTEGSTIELVSVQENLKFKIPNTEVEKLNYFTAMTNSYFNSKFSPSFYPQSYMIKPFVCVSLRGLAKITFLETRFGQNTADARTILRNVDSRFKRKAVENKISSIEIQVQELEKKSRQMPEVKLSERADRQSIILGEMTSLNLKLHQLRNSLTDLNYADSARQSGGTAMESNFVLLESLKFEF